MLTRRPHRPWGVGGEEFAQQLAEIPGNDSDCTNEFELEYRRQVFQWAAVQVREMVSESTWDAFWLSHGCGCSIGEVADRLGISRAQVYVARSRVMARLRDLVCRYEVQT